MADVSKRKCALTDFSLELRPKGWYFGRQYAPPGKYQGPYKSIASVTLMIARQLRREVERRDAAIASRANVQPIDEAAPPF